jgi:hypothetical protein
MDYTFDENIVSDLYKDAYGFRPRESFWMEWEPASNDEKQIIWDGLCNDLSLELAHEEMIKENSWQNLLLSIRGAFELGAKDQVQALRWLMEAEEFDDHDLMYGPDYFCYHFGIEYSKKKDLPIQEAMDEMKGSVE